MKLKIIAAVVAVAAVSQAGLVNWSSQEWKNTPLIFDTAVGGGYAGLYAADTIDVFLNAPSLELDLLSVPVAIADTTVSKVTSGPVFGQSTKLNGASLDTVDNTLVYTVIFDTPAVGIGSKFLVIDDGTFNTGAAQPPATAVAYTLPGAPTSGQAAWGTVIPEPATIGLMGIAGLGMFLARKKTRR